MLQKIYVYFKTTITMWQSVCFPSIFQGPAVVTGARGDRFEFNYVDNIIEGEAVYYAPPDQVGFDQI